MRLRRSILLTTPIVLLLAAAPASAAVSHTVQPGETLWSIAAANNLTTRTVAAFNGLSENAQVVLGSSINEKAAQQSWFVPTAKNWVNVENGNILRNMLAQILTGKLSIKQAAQSASDNISSVLNAS